MVWFDPPVDVLNRSLQDPESRDHEKRSFLICSVSVDYSQEVPDKTKRDALQIDEPADEPNVGSVAPFFTGRCAVARVARFSFSTCHPRSHGIGSDAFRPTVIQDDAPRILGRGGRRRGRREIAISGSERGCHHGTGWLSSLPAAARGFANRPLVGIAREAGLPRTWNISSSGVGARLARYAAILQTR